MSRDPIVETYDLLADPATAFDVYVARIGTWWDPRYTANAETLESVAIEPHIGGAVREVHASGISHEWGSVTVWEPGVCFAHTTRLGLRGGDATIITVRFGRRPAGGTRFTFEHSGWNRTNEADHTKFHEWRTILDRYARLADEAVRGPR